MSIKLSLYKKIVLTCHALSCVVGCDGLFSVLETFRGGGAKGCVSVGAGSGVTGGECCVIRSLNMTDDLRRAQVEFGGLKNPEPDAFFTG